MDNERYTPDGVVWISNELVSAYYADLNKRGNEGTLYDLLGEFESRVEKNNPNFNIFVNVHAEGIAEAIRSGILLTPDSTFKMGCYESCELIRRQIESNQLKDQ